MADSMQKCRALLCLGAHKPKNARHQKLSKQAKSGPHPPSK